MLREDKIEVVLKRDIDILVKGLLEVLPQKPEAIFLCGGYGRGEGAWLEGEDGAPQPYNDFDIAVVTECPLDKEKTDNLRKDLATKVNIRWVDIDYYSISELSRLKNTIHNIDLLYASRCIYGNENALKSFGPLDASKIGFYDIERLYKTRIWTLLGSWVGEFHDLSVEEAIFFKNQMVKATFAACDFLLVHNHQYHISYRRRADLVCQEYKDNDAFCKRVKWAIGEKLRPVSCTMNKKEMQSLYHECKRNFLWAASVSFGSRWKYYEQPERTIKHETGGIKQKLVKIYLRLKNQKYHQKYIEIFAAQNYALLAEKEDAINNLYVSKASEILLKWGYIKQPVTNWFELHNIVADARNNI